MCFCIGIVWQESKFPQDGKGIRDSAVDDCTLLLGGGVDGPAQVAAMLDNGYLASYMLCFHVWFWYHLRAAPLLENIKLFAEINANVCKI